MAKKKTPFAPDNFDPLEGMGDDIIDANPSLDAPSIQEPVILPPPAPSVDAVITNNQQMSATSEELFGRPVETENSVKSVAKELFSNDVIDLKTEISHNEINNLTRLRFMQEKFRLASGTNLDHVIASFLRLRVSKDRKSRKEFIEALQTETRNSQGGSFMQKLFGGGPS